MRLRLAPVEYKVCATAACGSKYEGAQCPKCQQPFDPRKMRKELHDRLILVDVDPPIYEQTWRCRCTECKNLYDLRDEEVVARALCDHCKKPLFRKEQLQAIWRDAETLLQRARKLDRARRQLQTCPLCAQPISSIYWCPLAPSAPHPEDTSCLPQNPIVTWLRTFHISESLEEFQAREWREVADEEEGWLAEETERETESDTAEMGQHGEE